MKFDDLTVRGIDISGYNGAMDWAKVKAHSHFVIIRAGYGNTTDKTFLANWQNASVPKAAYWYMDYYSNWYNKESIAYGLSDATFGILQANNCWDLLKGDPGGSIVWLDIESGGADYSPNITTLPAAGHAHTAGVELGLEVAQLVDRPAHRRRLPPQQGGDIDDGGQAAVLRDQLRVRVHPRMREAPEVPR